MKDIFQNIITFGGHGKVKVAEESYKNILSQFKSLNREYNKKEKHIRLIFEKLKDDKMKALLKVRKISKFSNLLNIKQRELLENELRKQEYNLKKIETSISIGEQALNLGKGSLIGLVSGSGVTGTAWALAGTYGIASTGTAISTLSGAAATNASLALFGGGSIASGGFGIVAGQIVLGGLTVVPAFLITGLYQRWQANKKVIEIKNHEVILIQSIDAIKSNIFVLKAVDNRIAELTIVLEKSIDTFDVTFNETYKSIYKYGYISKMWKRIRQWFGKKPFDDSELEKIMNLGLVTGNILKIIDTKIL